MSVQLIQPSLYPPPPIVYPVVRPEAVYKPQVATNPIQMGDAGQRMVTLA